MTRKDYDDWDEDFFGDMFSEFGFDFKKMNERMRKIWDRMLHDPDFATQEPYVYGFTYKVGPEGKPYFQEFGNMPGMRRERANIQQKDVREPITDITEDKDKSYFTFELPGISKENIDLKVSSRNVTISVKEGTRKYYKSIDLDYEVKPESAKARFVNGILDVSLEKTTKEGSGKTIDIE
ncbi:MAG TPA: archaeal heat shock protein Hsp20 [Thermoplasmataceae archaeon]|nr:archaeal heat shock protein Hsp20 [Thermoplasmataceae archaeon]